MIMKKNKYKAFIFFIIIAFVIYIIIDYIDLFHILGINFSNINIELFNIVFNSFIVVLLYIITYFKINKKEIDKEYNSKQIAYILMTSSYKQCKEKILLFDNNDIIHKDIVPKVDFNTLLYNNTIVNNLQNEPFSEIEHIIQLATNGYIEKELFNKYMSFKRDYKSYIQLKIIFFDIDTPKTEKQLELNAYIKNTRMSLLNTIKNELSELNKLMK